MLEENMIDHDTRKCPFCAEVIKKEASLCKHCRSSVTPISAELSKPANKVECTAPQQSEPPEKAVDIVPTGAKSGSKSKHWQVWWYFLAAFGICRVVSGVNYFLSALYFFLSIPLGLLCLIGLCFRPIRTKSAISSGICCFVFMYSLVNLARLAPAEMQRSDAEKQKEAQVERELADPQVRAKKAQEEKAKRAAELAAKKKDEQRLAAENALREKENREKRDAESPLQGEEGLVNSTVLAGTSKENFDEAMKASVNGDTLGLANMALAQQLINLPPGTKILVIGSGGWGVKQVRILSGKYIGASAYVSNERICRKLANNGKKSSRRRAR